MKSLKNSKIGVKQHSLTLLAIVLSVLPFMVSECSFSIFKLFLC